MPRKKSEFEVTMPSEAIEQPAIEQPAIEQPAIEQPSVEPAIVEPAIVEPAIVEIKKEVEVSPELQKLFEKSKEPKRRGRKKKVTRKKGVLKVEAISEEGEVEEEVEIFFDETIGKYVLNLYIEKLLKSKKDATPEEVESFTKLSKSLLKKYLPDNMLDYQEELNMLILVLGITISRTKEI